MKEQILSMLAPGHPWGKHIFYYDCVDSTNNLAKAKAAQGCPHGTVILAGKQTGGRGRLGRSFASPAGMGVYLSVILRYPCAPSRLMHLTCAAAVAVRDAMIAEAGIVPGIKWINDLVWEGRKIAGILTELSLNPHSGDVDFAIIGIGVNCRQSAGDFPLELREKAASLSMAAGRSVDPCAIAAAIIQHLYSMDSILLTGKSSLMERYRSSCITIGQEVSIQRAGCNVRHGKALAIDDDGALVVEFPDGHREALNSGEVSVRGMYGYL